jgi:hypothetical protein
LQLGDNQDDSTIMPAVLKGGDEAEPVLRELEKEARYQPIASRALAKTPPPGSRTIRTKSGIVFNIRVK